MSAIGSSWSEPQAIPALLPTGPSLGCATIDSSSLYQFISFDVSNAVKAWLTDPASNFGLAITGSGAVSIKLDAKLDEISHGDLF